MPPPRIVARPAFRVTGKKTWISGQDNAIFGRFWQQCQADGLFEQLKRLTGLRAGAQTGGSTLGVSLVGDDPANRAFDYLIGVETVGEIPSGDLVTHPVPACRWAVFECRGAMPDALVAAEMYAFMEWLPASGFVHARAPEIEVYPPANDLGGGQIDCEFWLPIEEKKNG